MWVALWRYRRDRPARPPRFPYLAAPNTELQSVAERVDLAAPPDAVWSVVGEFGAGWHPLIASSRLIGSGVGELRMLETVDGKEIIDRLDAVDASARSYRYSGISGIPASDYSETLGVKAAGAGSSVEWQAQYLGHGPGAVAIAKLAPMSMSVGAPLASLLTSCRRVFVPRWKPMRCR